MEDEIPMLEYSLFDEWADKIVRVVSAESSVAGWGIEHPVMKGNAREAIVRDVLGRFIPTGYDTGTGLIVDSTGAKSRQIDIVIARRDFPAFVRADGSKIYPIEGVLATLEVKSTLNRAELHKALSNCRSVGKLVPELDPDTVEEAANRLGLARYGQHYYVPGNPLETARWECRYRPVTYVVGFRGYKENSEALKTAIWKWAKKVDSLTMRHLPGLIASEGCYAWRNASPFPVDNEIRQLLGGSDENPLRLLVSHLLATIYERVPAAADFEGVRPRLRQYLERMRLPQIEWGLFHSAHPPDVD